MTRTSSQAPLPLRENESESFEGRQVGDHEVYNVRVGGGRLRGNPPLSRSAVRGPVDDVSQRKWTPSRVT